MIQAGGSGTTAYHDMKLLNVFRLFGFGVYTVRCCENLISLCQIITPVFYMKLKLELIDFLIRDFSYEVFVLTLSSHFALKIEWKMEISTVSGPSSAQRP